MYLCMFVCIYVCVYVCVCLHLNVIAPVSEVTKPKLLPAPRTANQISSHCPSVMAELSLEQVRFAPVVSSEEWMRTKEPFDVSIVRPKIWSLPIPKR